MLLTLEKVAKFYGSRLIIKDINLAVKSGEVTLLTGPNGAGKSTLLKIMAGLEEPNTGKVTLNLPEGSCTGYLGHQTFIYPQLSAAENLRFWSRLYSKDASTKRIQEVLERVELAPFAEERAGAFSRGMAQRLNLARILMLQPALLLLDEPATGLDVRSRKILDDEIALARQNGAGVVWISHSLLEDLPKADKVAQIAKRRLDFYGTVADFQTYTANEEATAPLKASLSEIPAGVQPSGNKAEGSPC